MRGMEPGTRYGQYTVVKLVHGEGQRRRMVLLRCDCGREKLVLPGSARTAGNRKTKDSTCPGCPQTALERFHTRYTVMPSGCWRWNAAQQGCGYGTYKDDSGRQLPAHLFAYREIVGPVAHGLHLDHLCRNRICVNPAHLQPVTIRENLLRSPITMASMNAHKTHCKYGHPLSGDNLRIRKDGGRACAMCYRMKSYPSLRKRKPKARSSVPSPS